MRIFIANLATETNTFSPLPTGWAAFREAGLHRGDVTTLAPQSMQGLVLVEWRRRAEQDGHAVVEGLAAFAQPGGRTLRRVYEELRDEIVDHVRASLPLDVVLLNLHGAMAGEGYDDCEGDLLARVRAVVGPGVTIGAELDLHCHLTPAMLEAADVLIAYKHYPHDDMVERARELYRICVDAAAGRTRPVMAAFDCRMVGLWPTTNLPMRGYIAALEAAEARAGVLSVSLGHGFPWADVADVGAKVWAVCDDDQVLAREVADEAGRAFVALRREIEAPILDVDAALDRAISAPSGLVVLADVADNAGGGAPSDSTFILRRLLERGLSSAATGCYWDPQAVALCAEAGVGASFDLRVGGKCGPVSGWPLDLRVTVRAIAPNHSQAGLSGGRYSLGASAWVEAEGVDLVLTSLRSQVFSPDAFEGLGLDLRARRIAVVKSTQHFHAAFAPLASEILYVDTPGAITPRFAEIPYTKRDLAFWPRVDDPFAKGAGPALVPGEAR